jgi:lipoate-protein ligase A
MAELKQGKSIFKAGKLLKVFVEFDERIRSIKITGDFFLHPEEIIFEIEKGLVGTDIDERAVKEKLEHLLKDADVFGFDAGQLAQAIMNAIAGAK